jgi:putative transposase
VNLLVGTKLRPFDRDGGAGVFQDRSPAAVQAILLDQGEYLCSTRTMYRILQQEGESGERRDQLVHPSY